MKLKLYSVRGWPELFENSVSRKYKNLFWVPVPNKHDGCTYAAIITHPKGAVIFTAWILMLQCASKCAVRGRLARPDGKPFTAVDLSVKTRAPIEWFETALEWLEKHSDWLEVTEVEGGPVETVGVEESGGTTGTSKTPRGRRDGQYHPDARVLLHFLNEKSGKHFRETADNLSVISARLAEPDVSTDGTKTMIERQCKRWIGTAQSEYLRPETLFGKKKFDGYYAAKDQPVINEDGPKRPEANQLQENIAVKTLQ